MTLTIINGDYYDRYRKATDKSCSGSFKFTSTIYLDQSIYHKDFSLKQFELGIFNNQLRLIPIIQAKYRLICFPFSAGEIGNLY